MKKIISFVAACTVLCQTSVFADTAIEKKNCAYTVKTDCGNGETVTMLVAKKGESLDDENIVAIREGKSYGGEISFEFEFENDTAYEGEYTIYVYNNQLELKSEMSFTHATDDTVEKAEEWLKGVSDSAEILEMLEEDSEYRIALQAMGMKLDIYDGVSEKEDIVSMFLAEKSGADNLSGLMNKCIGTVMINKGYDAEESLLCIEPSFEDTSFGKITDDGLKKWILDIVGGDYKKTDEVTDRYNEICILYKFKTAKFSEFSKLFDKYAKALGIEDDSTYKDYDDLSSSKKSDVGDELVEIQAKNPAETAEELVDNLEDAYDDAVDGEKKNNGGGSGGGGGGSRGNAVNTVNPGAAIVENKTEIPDVKEEFVRYNDIDSVTWAATAINELTKEGIVSGDGNGTFRPNDNVTREEFAKMLVSALDMVDENASCGFDDVGKNDWFYKYVASAYTAGIVNGISETEFGVKRNITRQEMAAMSARALERYKKAAEIRTGITFEDDEMIADWAKGAVDTLYRAGIMSGTDGGNFEPEKIATRAQAAVVIYNLIK